MLLKEMLTQPGFRQDKLDLARVQLRNAISHRNDNAGDPDATRSCAGMVYGGDTPFGWQQQYATIDRITRADRAQFLSTLLLSRQPHRWASAAISTARR